MPRRPMTECPHCGESFRSGRPSCPHCGSDAETGWRPDAEIEAASVDLGSTHLDDEHYEEFLTTEGLSSSRRRRVPLLLLVFVLVLILALLLLL